MNEWVVWLFEGIVAAAALLILFSKSVFHAALCLLVVVIGIGVIFGLYGSEFLFLSQIMIYGGGILVLILFITLVVSKKELQEKAPGSPALPAFVGFIGVAIMFADFVRLGQPKGVPYPTSTKILGAKLLTDYSLPLEIAGVLLLVSLIGAILSSTQKPQQP